MEAHRPIVVQKFGGSSVADAERLRQVAERVALTYQAGKRVVVVVSAMGKTTDQLIELARSVAPDPSRRELDMLLSAGERISMSLLAMALEHLGVPAISFTGSQSGILTNDCHSGARIIEVRPVRIQDELERGKVVIVAGFQGMSYKREITTLGRGGSDTTAVALAAALGAESCEIYSDVDGVYSADPRVVPECKHLDAVSYDEMQQLAEFGAKVLNAQAVEWARKAGIVLLARATGVRASQGETRIGGPPREARGAIAVASLTRLARVRLSGAKREGPALLELLAEEGVALTRFFAGDHIVTLFSRDNLPDYGRIAARLAATFPAVVIDEIGAVTAVGTGVGSDACLLRLALEAARAVGVDVAEWDTAPLRLTLYVSPTVVDEVTRALHRALVAPLGNQ